MMSTRFAARCDRYRRDESDRQIRPLRRQVVSASRGAFQRIRDAGARWISAWQALRRARPHGRSALLLLLLIGATHGTEPMPSAIATRMLDASRSRAEFEVKVLWLVGIHGSFDQVYGEIALDRFRSMARVDARIRVNTVAMRNRTYEDWVKSSEFFDAKQFPQIRFISDWFDLARLENGGVIEGTLELRGRRRRERFVVAPSTCASAAVSACPAQVAGEIRRSDYGMHSRRGTLSDKVELRFTIYVAAQDAAP